MEEFGSEDLFNVLDDKPAEKRRPDEKTPSAGKKRITPEILGKYLDLHRFHK